MAAHESAAPVAPGLCVERLTLASFGVISVAEADLM